MKPARKLMDKLYNEKSGAAINFGNHKRMLDSCNQRMASISERLGQIDDEVPGAQEEREQLRLESEQLVRSIDELNRALVDSQVKHDLMASIIDLTLDVLADSPEGAKL